MAKPKYRLIWSADAEDDLLTIWRYGADEWSPAVADDHLHEIWRASNRLLENPELGKSRDELIHWRAINPDRPTHRFLPNIDNSR